MTDDAPSTIVRTRKPASDGGDLRARVPALTILWHYDPGRVGQSAPLAAASVTEVSRYTPPFDPVADVVLSRNPFLLVERHGESIILRPSESKTSVAVDGTPLLGPRHVTPDHLQQGLIINFGDQIIVCLHRLRTPVLRGAPFGLVGTSDIIEGVRRQIGKVASLDVPVLVRGESGTGKEIVARAIASASLTPVPFVAVNMGEIPITMAVATLFGHEKGAFTGAGEAHSGLFAQADGGTLFLDEIASMPVDVQKTLLRVLDTKEVRSLGSRRPRTVKVRIITATDKDLEAAVRRGVFEGPLLNRIKEGYRIDLPALRERREDIGSLLLHFLRRNLEATSELDRLRPRDARERPWLDARDVARIALAYFPGNLRDLSHIASQIVVSSRGQFVARLDAEVERLLSVGENPLSLPSGSRRRQGQGLPTNPEIEDALRRHGFNHSAAAADLGIHRDTLHKWARANPGSVRKAEDVSDEELLRAYDLSGGDTAKMAAELRVSPKPLKHRLDALLRRKRPG